MTDRMQHIHRYMCKYSHLCLTYKMKDIHRHFDRLFLLVFLISQVLYDERDSFDYTHHTPVPIV